MTILLKKNGKNKIPDWPKFVESLTPAQIKFLGNVMEDAIAKDNEVFLEFYAALANHHHNKMTRAEKRDGAEEAEERFFTEEAFERHERDRAAARDVVDTARDKGLIWTPDSGEPPERIM